MFQEDDLCALLERYAWEYKQLPDGQVITGFQGRSGRFSILFQIKQNWLAIIAPLTPDHIPFVSQEKKEQAYAYLLELNSQYPLIRFILVEEKIAIVADIPIKKDQVDFDLFKTGMDLVSEVVDKFTPQIREKVSGDIK